MSTTKPARGRRTFSRLDKVLEVPHLINIQRKSYEWFLNEGLRETIDDISPIMDFTGTLAVDFGTYTLGGWQAGEPLEYIQPNNPIKECREKDLTYAAPLTMEVSFVNQETGEIRRQKVFMGDLPLMTDWGTFIINGTERVIVTQLVRSPGAYIMEPKDREKQVFVANLMPARGSWLELEIDKKGLVNVRIDRKRKLPVTTLLFALGYTRNDILNLFPHPEDKTRVNPFIEATLEKDPIEGEAATGNKKSLKEIEAIVAEMTGLYTQMQASHADERSRLQAEIDKLEKKIEQRAGETMQHALIEVFKKQRPGEPPTVDTSRSLVRSLFFDAKRYDLTKVGRYKLNARLGSDLPTSIRTLTSPRFTGGAAGMSDDLVRLIKELVDLPVRYGLPEESKDFAADAALLPRDELVHELDEYEHFGNRRLRTVGELIQEAFRVGLYRMERVVRERMSTEDADTITPQTIINIRPVVAALKEFFGSSQLSQFMDQTNSLAGLTHRRRLSALGAGGLTRERAPIEVRDVHTTHYGRMCPIETPEGPNIGLIGSLSSYATINEYGFIQTPYRKVVKGVVTDEVVRLDATQEEHKIIAQANADVDAKGKLVGAVLCRKGGQPIMATPSDVDFMDVSPEQIVSVATALIPFLEHNDANRALMGANMQRQAVPLMITDAPLIGTGMERRAAIDTGDVVVSRVDGAVVSVDATHIIVEDRKGELFRADFEKFTRSNQGTIIHQKPIVRMGDKVSAGDVLADGSSTSNGELALGKNMLVAFMSWEGYNFEDAIIVSERLVKDDVLSSIHIEEYEIDARTTKLGAEEITRDIPNRSEESLRDLDERGVVRIGAEVTSGDLLVGKVTPKGETEAPAGAQSLTPASRELIRELKLPPDIMEGLDQELAVPAAWLEGAKKEGIVHVTMITDERDFDRLWKVFAARYPGIKYEYTRGVGQQRALQPLLAYRRGTYITDVVSSFQVLEAEYRKADSLLNIVSLLPAVKSTRPEFNSEAGIGVAYRLTNFCMAYASERVKKEELPKTWEELVASPRWRNGKVGMAANANSWMVELWGHKGEAWGRDYVRRIFTELRPQLRKENLTTIGRLAALGEYDIAIPVSDAAVNNLAKKGIAAGFHCPDVVPVAIQWVGVLKGNPHPNASLLFTNWLISKEGQIATHWADSLTPANRGLARKEFLPYPEQVLGKPAAPLAGSALRDMPQIMEYWISHWNKAGGPGGPGGEGAKAGKGGPR